LIHNNTLRFFLTAQPARFEKRHCSTQSGSDCPAKRERGGQHRFSLCE
jgi:hypothetical protein